MVGEWPILHYRVMSRVGLQVSPDGLGYGLRAGEVRRDGAAGFIGLGEPIRVLVVDDHALFRRGLQMVLGAETDIEVVGEASDGAEALKVAAETTPDIVLMDVRMPKRGGIDATTAIKGAVPSTKIIMLTISDEEADLYDAIKAGAMGYLLKEISIEEVASAVRAVYNGQSLISPSMASKLLTEFATMVRKDDERQQVPTPRLTDREMEVLKLVAKGINNRDIAKKLFISENTVKNHIRNILEKLQLHSRMEAVVYAVREKLSKSPDVAARRRRGAIAAAGALAATAAGVAVSRSPVLRKQAGMAVGFVRRVNHPPAPPVPPTLLPGRIVLLPGRGEVFVRDSGSREDEAPTVLLLHGWTVGADLNFFAVYEQLSPAPTG